jgi:hypothetical protein
MTSTTTRVSDAVSSAADAAASTAERVSDRMTDATERLRGNMGDTDRRLRQLVDEYPLTCFLGAVLGGYLLGRMATRL